MSEGTKAWAKQVITDEYEIHWAPKQQHEAPTAASASTEPQQNEGSSQPAPKKGLFAAFKRFSGKPALKRKAEEMESELDRYWREPTKQFKTFFDVFVVRR